ncbi:hypothetical protein [Actinomadura fibrosa]|uniref:GerMN domain-containing protein n=1 Tax=Actinomadura fibrosa TaxID=111802 RepID=A0ABW2XKA4_9ACTN|nr:hypothetical protein [Actinomadura fibrosa]
MRRWGGPNRGGAAVLAAVLAAATAAGAAATAGCGVRPTGVLSAGAKPVASGTATSGIVYLLSEGRMLVPAVRPGLPGHPYLPLAQLQVPPTMSERRHGLTTAVLPRPLLRAFTATDDPSLLIVGMADEGPLPAGYPSRAALAQIVCTATAISGIDAVDVSRFPQTVAPRSPLSCDDFDDMR